MGNHRSNMGDNVLKCGSKNLWIGLTIGCAVLKLVFFIVAGAVGGCSCAGSCESSFTEYMSGCKNPKLCSTGDGILAVEPAVASLPAPNTCPVARIPSFAAQATGFLQLRLTDNQPELFSLKSSLLSLRSFLELSSRVGSALVPASGNQQNAAQTIRFLLW